MNKVYPLQKYAGYGPVMQNTALAKSGPPDHILQKNMAPQANFGSKKWPALAKFGHPPNCSLLTLTIHFWETEKAIDSHAAGMAQLVVVVVPVSPI